MRITSETSKAATVVVGVLLAIIATPIAAAGGGLATGYVVGTAISVGLVVLATRTFRGPGEAVEPPRPWWRATNRPTAGYVLGVLYLLQAVTLLTRLDSGSVRALTWLSVAICVAIGAYFLHSSARLAKAPAAAGHTTAA